VATKVVIIAKYPTVFFINIQVEGDRYKYANIPFCTMPSFEGEQLPLSTFVDSFYLIEPLNELINSFY